MTKLVFRPNKRIRENKKNYTLCTDWVLWTVTSYKLHYISQNTKRNVITAYDVRFDVNKPNDTRKITGTCPLNVV